MMVTSAVDRIWQAFGWIMGVVIVLTLVLPLVGEAVMYIVVLGVDRVTARKDQRTKGARDHDL